MACPQSSHMETNILWNDNVSASLSTMWMEDVWRQDRYKAAYPALYLRKGRCEVDKHISWNCLLIFQFGFFFSEAGGGEKEAGINQSTANYK